MTFPSCSFSYVILFCLVLSCPCPLPPSLFSLDVFRPCHSTPGSFSCSVISHLCPFSLASCSCPCPCPVPPVRQNRIKIEHLADFHGRDIFLNSVHISSSVNINIAFPPSCCTCPLSLYRILHRFFSSLENVTCVGDVMPYLYTASGEN